MRHKINRDLGKVGEELLQSSGLQEYALVH